MAAEEASFVAKFASPEQLQRGTVDFSSEIYSLGATLWFLLTGAAPVAGTPLGRKSGVPKPVVELLQQMLSPNPKERPHDPVAFEDEVRKCLGQPGRAETVDRKFGGRAPVTLPVTLPVIRPVLSVEPRRPSLWKPLALAALFVGLAALAALIVLDGLNPRQTLARFTQPKPVGVPIGVPEASAPTDPGFVAEPVSSDPSPSAIVSTEPEETAQLQQEAIAANEGASESSANEQSEPAVLESVPSSVAAEATNAYASQAEPSAAPVEPPPAEAESPEPGPQLVATNETTSASAEEEEPAPPSEGPDETAAPPNYAAQEAELLARASEMAATPAAAEPPAPQASATPSAILPRLDRPVATEPTPTTKEIAKPKKRPKQIDGMEVRAAEPVREADLVPPPETPAGPDGAQFVGIAPDGSLIFEAPPVQRRSAAKPRR